VVIYTGFGTQPTKLPLAVYAVVHTAFLCVASAVADPTVEPTADAVAQWRHDAGPDGAAITGDLGRIKDSITMNQPDFGAVIPRLPGYAWVPVPMSGIRRGSRWSQTSRKAPIIWRRRAPS